MKETFLVIGASSDLARASIRSLADPNRQFILHYNRNKEAIEKTMSLLDQDQVLMSIQADLSKGENIDRFIQSIPFKVDGILFAQGRDHYQLLTETDEKAIDELYQLHVKTTIKVTQVFLPQMIKERKGKIVIISSVWGEIGASHESIYATMKGAQLAFMKSVAKEVGPSGVQVNAVAPGLIQTKMNNRFTEREYAAWIDDLSIKRIGVAEDVAGVVKFLFSNASSYVHGQVFRVDGGM